MSAAAPEPEGRKAFAIDVGGTKVQAAIVDERGRMGDHRTAAADWSDSGAGIVRQCLALVQDGVSRHPAVACVGVAATGVFSLDGRVAGARPGREAWQGVDLAARIADRTGLPARVANDSQLMALGEHRFGRAAGSARVLLGVSLGTGLGAGLVIDGRLFRGAFGGAGEIGHVTVDEAGRACHCGRRGCAEAHVAGPALAARYRERTGVALATPEICERADRGEESAARLLDEVVAELASALESVLAVVDADVVVLGGGLGMRLAGRLGELRQALGRSRLFAQRPTLSSAALGEAAPLFGAAALAFDALGRP